MPSPRSSPAFFMNENDMYFETVASYPAPNPPCGTPTPRATCQEIEEFLAFSLRQRLKTCFINHNFDWRLRPHNKKFYRIAKFCFLRKMEAAGCPYEQAKGFLRAVKYNLASNDDFGNIINVDILDQWESLL